MNTFSPDFDELKQSLLHSLLNRSYEIESETATDEEFLTPEEGESFLIDEEDKEILMHRDAHFAGNFDAMLESYREEKRGAVLDVSLKRIESLYNQEKGLKKNIAPYLLSGTDSEKIAESKKMYAELRSLYEQQGDKENISTAIADLILTENEEPQEEIEKVISYADQAITPLIELINSQLFQDPLFPGYGKAPLAAATALGQLYAHSDAQNLSATKNILLPKVLRSLFDLMRQNNTDYEETALAALRSIGASAKEFLMKQLAAKPITQDNEQAAVALHIFADDADIATFCFKMLQDKELQKKASIALYLVLGCESLPMPLRNEFIKLVQSGVFPEEVRREAEATSKYWDKNSASDRINK